MKTQHAVRTAAFAIPIFCASLLSSPPPSGVDLTKQSIAKLVISAGQTEPTQPSQAVIEQVSTTFEQLEQIKQAFSLKISELSEILNTSRPTIYAWLNGSSPKDRTSIEKISYISQVALRFASLSFIKPEAMIKRPVLSGNRTLLQCLKEGLEVSDEDLRTLQQIDKKEAAKRLEPKLSYKRRNDIESITTPIINELV